ncbi:MAG: MFS transporter [Acidimicrobiia bacterium]
MSRAGGSGPARRFGMWPMVVLALVNLVDQIDVAILRGVLPFLEDEWGLSDFQLGLLGFVFIFVNTIATIPAGWVADHYRRTRVMGWTLLSWSGLIVLSATAVNYLNLLFARAVMGIGQSVDDPASTSLLGDYYPARMRARAFSFQQVVVFVGGGIGLALGGYVGSTLGWRWAFALVGMPGSLVAVLAFRLREPRRGEAELPDGAHPGPEPEVSPARGLTFRAFVRKMFTDLSVELRMIFGIRTMRYILIGVSALLFTVAGISYWLAVYHERYSGMTVTEATAFTAAVLGVGGIIGTFGGGAFGDRVFGTRGPSARVAFVVWSALACTVLFLISFALANVGVRLALQFLGVVAAAGSVPSLRASMLDVLPAQSRGIGASAFALAAAVFGTALAPVLVGVLSDLTSLVGAFYIVFPPVMVGLLFLLRARTTIVEDAAAIIAASAAAQAEIASAVDADADAAGS